MHEFDLINHYFKSRPNKRTDVFLGIGDDCALLQPPTTQLLAVSTDTLVENVHFLPTTAPQALGYKSLAVSLSDLAAMGAEPAWVMLSLSLPHVDTLWLENFCQGFFALLDSYQMQLIGGNTTRGPLAITTHVTGFVPQDKSLTRNGAKIGDDIYITGQVGDAALALRCLQQKSALPDPLLIDVIRRLEYPSPRVEAGMALRGIANSCIDISDGLAADLQHILTESNCGALIDADKLPLSPALSTLPITAAWELILTGGDDYELCFTAPPEQRLAIREIFTQLNCVCHRIGAVETTLGLRVRYGKNQMFDLRYKGFEHF